VRAPATASVSGYINVWMNVDNLERSRSGDADSDCSS
jgi:hypothetical protein